MSVADNTSIGHMRSIAKQLLSKERELDKYDIQISFNDLKSGGSDQLIFAKNNVKFAACWGSGRCESLSVGGRIYGSYALYLANS